MHHYQQCQRNNCQPQQGVIISSRCMAAATKELWKAFWAGGVEVEGSSGLQWPACLFANAKLALAGGLQCASDFLQEGGGEGVSRQSCWQGRVVAFVAL